jgi:hypothetical protein
MASTNRLNVTLDAEYAVRLAALAARAHVQEGTLARSLLSQAIDQADADPANVMQVLDGIDGAFERANMGLDQARSGRTTDLGDV